MLSGKNFIIILFLYKKNPITVNKTQFDAINLFSASSPLHRRIVNRTYILRL